MKQFLNLAILFIALAMIPSCREKDLDMTPMTQTLYEGAEINEITAEDAWNITVVQDNENSFVELEYSAFLDEYIQVSKEGPELKIGFSRYLNLPANTVMNATIHTASVKKLHFSDAVTAVLEGQFPETALTLELEDASTCKGGNFTGIADVKLSSASTLVDCYFHGRSCEIELEDASVFKGWFTEDSLTVKVDEASRLTTYGGYVSWADVVVSDASFLNMLETYVSEKMTIAVQDASEASVAVWRPATLEGWVIDASALYYKGNPTLDVGCDASSILRPL